MSDDDVETIRQLLTWFWIACAGVIIWETGHWVKRKILSRRKHL